MLEPCGSSRVSRFSHSTASFPGGDILICGGFGMNSRGSHSRLSSVLLFNRTEDKLTALHHNLDSSSSETMLERLSATLVPLHDSINTVVLIGGRRSPNQAFKETLLLEYDSASVKCRIVSVHQAAARWRHVSTWVPTDLDSQGAILVHGGRTADQASHIVISSDLCYLVITHNKDNMPKGIIPKPRISSLFRQQRLQ